MREYLCCLKDGVHLLHAGKPGAAPVIDCALVDEGAAGLSGAVVEIELGEAEIAFAMAAVGEGEGVDTSIPRNGRCSESLCMPWNSINRRYHSVFNIPLAKISISSDQSLKTEYEAKTSDKVPHARDGNLSRCYSKSRNHAQSSAFLLRLVRHLHRVKHLYILLLQNIT